MDQNTKQRLVGITVIFALAVIFLPMLLDGSGVREQQLEVVIPEQLAIPSNPEFEQKIVELHARASELPSLQPQNIEQPEVSIQNQINRIETEAVMAQQPEVSKPQVSAAITPAVATEPLTGGISWVLQVGSFQDRTKALAQRDKLRKSNIAAVFLEQFKGNSQVSYRVRLGPFLSREQARVAQNKIKAKHNIDGLIMKYEK